MLACQTRGAGWIPLAIALTTGCGPAVSTEDFETRDEADDSRQEIVGGSATSDFVATGALTLWGSMHCTGTLIEPRKVVTAAHCLQGVSASSMAFVLGPSLWAPQAKIAVASIAPHPQYDDSQLTDDIGYVTLAQDAPVAPMKILSGMDGSWVGKSLVFVGYGITSGNGGGSGTKRSVTIPIAQVWASQFEYQTQGKNTCNGDSGGPAFAKVGNEWLVAGVTSYGDVWCQQYGVDTRVDVYASFLNVASGGSGNPPPADPCGGETFEGRCQGSTVVWCENDEIHSIACQKCGFDWNKGFYNCL